MLTSILRRSVHLSLLLGVTAVFGLTGCGEFKKVDDNIAETQTVADKALASMNPSSPIAQPLSIDKRPYFGSQAVPITNGSPLPSQYEQSGAVVMTFARPVSMPELMRMIQAVTGLRAIAPTSTSKTSDGAATEGAATGPTFTPTDGEQVAGGRIVWQGRLSDLLNQAADTFDADWSYDGNAIMFSQQITRTFMLNALASELQVKGSVTSGGSSDSGSNLPTVDVTSTSSMKVWDEIKEAIVNISGSYGKAAFSPSTGTITVTGSPDVVRRVEAYLNQQNSMRLRRVAVAVKVIAVTASNDFDLSSDITGIVRRAFDQASLRSVGEATSGIAIGVLKSPLAGTDEAAAQTEDGTDGDAIKSDRLVSAFRADKHVQNATISHSGAIVTLSDQPAPLQVGRQISYLARTSTTTGDTGGSVSLEPGTVNTGLMMTILPRIVDGNRILMRISVAITSADQPFATFGPDGNQIQLPELDTTGFLQNAVLTSGETMVLAGFEKKENSRDNDGTPDAFLLGGSKSSSRSREITVMVLTAQILPEDPITVIGD